MVTVMVAPFRSVSGGSPPVEVVHARKAAAVDGGQLLLRHAERPVALGLAGGVHAAIRAESQNVLNGQNGKLGNRAQEGADDGIVAFQTCLN